MNLSETIYKLENSTPETFIFVKALSEKINGETDALLLELSEEELELPLREVAKKRAPGYKYFLEAFLVKEIVDDWEVRYGESKKDDLLKTIINYAKNDC